MLKVTVAFETPENSGGDLAIEKFCEIHGFTYGGYHLHVPCRISPQSSGLNVYRNCREVTAYCEEVNFFDLAVFLRSASLYYQCVLMLIEVKHTFQ
jgi:hypothetical protein